MNDMKQFNASFYDNSKGSVYIILIEPISNRLYGIYRLTYYPLFNEYELLNLQYPSRQQLHSQRYYVQRNYTYLNKLVGTLNEITIRAKTLVNQEECYDFGSDKQINNIMFK